ncbi:MAG: YggS family pyridoxal phosphate-dependent enzyme [Gemmatimonadota bacterium]
MEFPSLADRLARARVIVAEAQRRGGWTHPVRIVAVTKTHGPESVRAAAAAGLTDVGENRVQEALPKQSETADVAVEWHLIGGLQRNKVRHAAGRFALIHTVDRDELAAELQKRVAEGARQGVLVQVNCSREPQKGGVEPDALPALLDSISRYDRLELRGLMTMAAFDANESAQRRTFAQLRALRDVAAGRGWSLPELSMGMSGDFAAAAEEGATMLRLGTLLFGERAQA